MLVKPVALAALLYATQASAAFFVGDKTGSDTFNRPEEDLSGLSGEQVAYDSFSVDAAGSYLFFSVAQAKCGPGNVTAPVPEPETYAMMLAGLAAVGLMIRRRNAG
jgi:hypothetical protein